MSSLARRVAGDSVVATAVLVAFTVFVLALRLWVDKPSAGEFDGLATVVWGFWSLPVWYAVWASLLRIRRSRVWWLTPLVAAGAPLVVFAGIDSQRPLAVVWTLYAVAVIATAGVWSWVWEQARGDAY